MGNSEWIHPRSDEALEACGLGSPFRLVALAVTGDVGVAMFDCDNDFENVGVWEDDKGRLREGTWSGNGDYGWHHDGDRITGYAVGKARDREVVITVEHDDGFAKWEPEPNDGGYWAWAADLTDLPGLQDDWTDGPKIHVHYRRDPR